MKIERVQVELKLLEETEDHIRIAEVEATVVDLVISEVQFTARHKVRDEVLIPSSLEFSLHENVAIIENTTTTKTSLMTSWTNGRSDRIQIPIQIIAGSTQLMIGLLPKRRLRMEYHAVPVSAHVRQRSNGLGR